MCWTCEPRASPPRPPPRCAAAAPAPPPDGSRRCAIAAGRELRARPERGPQGPPAARPRKLAARPGCAIPRRWHGRGEVGPDPQRVLQGPPHAAPGARADWLWPRPGCSRSNHSLRRAVAAGEGQPPGARPLAVHTSLALLLPLPHEGIVTSLDPRGKCGPDRPRALLRTHRWRTARGTLSGVSMP